MLRDRIVPLCDLRRALELEPLAPQPELPVLVVSVAGAEVGLIVDEFHAGADIIPHPLVGPLAGLGYLSGTALLG